MDKKTGISGIIVFPKTYPKYFLFSFLIYSFFISLFYISPMGKLFAFF